VQYLPGKENLTGMNVTVHGLSPSSFFLFRVYSVSELNQLENNKDNWNYAEVYVKTKESKHNPTEGMTAKTTTAPRTDEETKSASSMYVKIVYGLVGLLIVVVASVACYIVFKRWRHRKEARTNQAPITDGSEIRVYEDIPMLPVSENQNHDDVIWDVF